MLKMTDETAGWIGAFVVSLASAIYARRSDNKSSKIVKEVMGPDSEPTLRQMMTTQAEKAVTHRLDVMEKLGDLAEGQAAANIRMGRVEDRMRDVEKEMKNGNGKNGHTFVPGK